MPAPDPTEPIEINARLVPAAMSALEDAATLEGQTMQDAINRALQFYCFLVAERRAGSRLFLGANRWSAREVTWK